MTNLDYVPAPNMISIENIELLVHYEAIFKSTSADLNWLIYFSFIFFSLILHNRNLFGHIYWQAF